MNIGRIKRFVLNAGPSFVSIFSKQVFLNTGLFLIAMFGVVIATSSIFHFSPLATASWMGNLAVYIISLVSFFVVLPVALGIVSRLYVVEWLDEKFGHRGERVPNWLNIVLAVVIGLFAASLWEWLTPIVSRTPSLSAWPIDFFRWHPNAEGTNWMSVILVTVLTGMGFWAGIVKSDEKHAND